MTEREIALFVALSLPLLGLLFEFVHARLRLRGFGDIAREVKTLAHDLHAEVDRDDTDLLVRGRYGNWPVLVRFSHSDSEPGVGIQIPVPCNLTFYCFPMSHTGEEGQTALRTSDKKFMSRFRLSTDNTPLEVSMILSSPDVTAELGKICDSQTSLSLENRNLNVRETAIIPGGLASRLMICIRGMARIAAEAAAATGGEADTAKSSLKRGRNWFRTGYMAASALILVGVGADIWAHRPKAQVVQPQIAPKAAITMPEAEAAQIPRLGEWHVAEASELDSEGAGWLQQQGQTASGHIIASVDSDQSQDGAYILKRANAPAGANASRIVLFIGKAVRYDAEMPQIDVAGRIAKDRLNTVEWRGRGSSGAPNGDGIILIQRYDDPTSAIIFYMSGVKLMTGVPKDFRTLSLE